MSEEKKATVWNHPCYGDNLFQQFSNRVLFKKLKQLCGALGFCPIKTNYAFVWKLHLKIISIKSDLKKKKKKLH